MSSPLGFPVLRPNFPFGSSFKLTIVSVFFPLFFRRNGECLASRAPMHVFFSPSSQEVFSVFLPIARSPPPASSRFQLPVIADDAGTIT